MKPQKNDQSVPPRISLRVLKWSDPVPSAKPDEWNQKIEKWKERYPIRQKEKTSLTLGANAILLEAKGQIGLSYRLQVDAFSTDNIFLKQPPPPTPLDIKQFSSSKKYYAAMRQKLVAEFDKNLFLSHIRRSCTKNTFSIPQPIALCEAGEEFEEENIPGLLYQFIDGPDLTKINNFQINDEKTFFDFAEGLAESVRIVHNHGILHSFIVPRNIINSKKLSSKRDKYSLVGFGYATLCDSKPDAPRIENEKEDNCYRAPECLASDNLGALWFPADIYSIGAILYRYVINKTPSDLPKDVTQLKQYVYEQMKMASGAGHEKNTDGVVKQNSLFWKNENIVKILDKCLRHNADDRYSCAEELLEALAIAKSAGKNIKSFSKSTSSKSKETTPAVNQADAAKLFINVATKNVADNASVNSLFKSVLQTRAVNLFEDAKKIGRGHYEVYGHRETLVTSLCRLLAGAHKQQVYRTMTYPGYWTDGNLGSNGRFLTMNKHMARKGLHIQRLFLVTTDFHQLIETEQEILEAQYEAQCDVESDEKIPKNFEIKVKILNAKEEAELLRFEVDATQVAYLGPDVQKPEGERLNECLCLNFISQGKLVWMNGRKTLERSIKKIRYWEPTDYRKEAFNKSLGVFWTHWNSESISLGKYIEAKSKSKSLSAILREPETKIRSGL